MLKYLLPVDGSDTSLHAVRHVIKLAKEHVPLSVHLLNVYYEPVQYGDIGVNVTPEQMRDVARRQTDAALSTAEQLLRDAGVAYEREVHAGDVPVTIARRAGELGCDGIVMGTRGAGALTSLVMGSVAMKVVHLSGIPVTLVK
jgi:nucleotide-binding universal stress UspA family protein